MIRILSLAAALLLAAPACAQRQSTHREHRDETRIVQEHGGRRLEIVTRGDVEFNDAGDWVSRVGPGGGMHVEERERGTTRRAEFLPGGGQVRVRYLVNGREREMDAEGREWVRRALFDAVRSSGANARRRVHSLRGRGGVQAVLSEIGQLRGDVARRAYFQALLAGPPLSSAEMERAMALLDREMESDVERRVVLAGALPHVAAEAVPSVLNAAAGMDSDVERRLVLVSALRRGLPSGEAQTAFFRVVDRFGSDVERRVVLTEMLRGSPAEAATVAALQSAARMDSDREKRIVLMQVPASQLRSPRVTAAYRAVVERMDSDSERSTALRRLARGS